MILGIERAGDLPGSEAPQRYFDFLKTGNIALLEDVLRHNRQDIATLALLLVKLCEIYQQPERLTERKDIFSVGKALERQGEMQPARALYQASATPAPAGTLEALTGQKLAGEASWRLYQIERRSGNVDGMQTVLEQMLRRGQMPVEVRVELAKLYEHRRHDFRCALQYAREARQLCGDDDAEAVDRRIARLEKKLDKMEFGRH